MSRWFRGVLVACSLSAASCAPSRPAAFVDARTAAQRAYAHGRYAEAARHWQRAARASGTWQDRDEASYRAATSLARAGQRQEALDALKVLVDERPRSRRAARALYDRAHLELGRGNTALARSLFRRTVASYPRSGSARSAVHRLLTLADAEGGVEAAAREVEELLARFGRSAVSELLRYRRARLLEARGLHEQALAAYLDVAHRYPYPKGDFWDDALFRASLVEASLGRPARAVQHLRRMLAEREPSHLQGSYERPRFSEAQYRLGVLYRDHLNDPAQARREFAAVWRNHPTSLLRDDARWNEALLASREGDTRGACRSVDSLVRERPDSRYAPCARLLCAAARSPARGECRAYIARQIDPANPAPE